MQGIVDSTGMLVASAVGKYPLTVTAIVPGIDVGWISRRGGTITLGRIAALHQSESEA